MTINSRVFISYVSEDHSWAQTIASILANLGIPITRPAASGEDFEDWLQEVAREATHTMVLVGVSTRLSEWVDREIAITTEYRKDGPGAGLIGIILPTSESFAQRYYDPTDVPLRLHDLSLADYAVIRKWSERGEDVAQWLGEAARRRSLRRPEPSLRVAARLHRFAWDAAVDVDRTKRDPP